MIILETGICYKIAKYFNKDVTYPRQELRRIDADDIRIDGTVIVDECEFCLQINDSDIEPDVEPREYCSVCYQIEGKGWLSTWCDAFIDVALDDKEKNYLHKLIDSSEELGFIIDKLIVEATTFRGSGYVRGFSKRIGLENIDERPAEYSESGAFVFNSKSVAELGRDFLENMVADA